MPPFRSKRGRSCGRTAAERRSSRTQMNGACRRRRLFPASIQPSPHANRPVEVGGRNPTPIRRCVVADEGDAAMGESSAMTSEWWREAVLYQIYPRSYQDTDGDCVGNVAGVTRRLGYLDWLGVDAIWLSPMFPSPMADYGYDVSNYRDVDPVFGDLKTLEALITEAHDRGKIPPPPRKRFSPPSPSRESRAPAAGVCAPLSRSRSSINRPAARSRRTMPSRPPSKTLRRRRKCRRSQRRRRCSRRYKVLRNSLEGMYLAYPVVTHAH